MKSVHMWVRILICVLVIAMLPVGAAFAQDADGLQWQFENGTLRVSCQGEMDLAAGVPWEAQKPEIKTVQIEAGVTSIGANAFMDCTSLETVSLPDSLLCIGENAFRNCTKLHWTTLPEKLETIKDGAFLGCGVLKTIVIPKRVSSIDQEAFETTTRLRGYSNSATEDYAKSRGCVFTSCGGSKIPTAEGTWGEQLKWTLEKNGVLTLTGEGAAPEGEIPWAPYRSAIRTVKIEEGVTSVGDEAFKNCRKLRSVELPESLTQIGAEAFRSCTGLKEIAIPVGVQTVGDNAFDESIVKTVKGAVEETVAVETEPAVEETTAAETEETVEETVAAETEAAVEETVAAETEAAVEETVAEETEAAVEETVAEETEAAVEETAAVETEETVEGTVAVETEETVEETVAEETEAAVEETVAVETEETAPAETEAAVEEPKYDGMILHLSRENGKTGGAVNVIVSAENAPGICGLSFAIRYNEDVLSLKGYECLNQEMGMNDWTMAIGRSNRALWLCSEPAEPSGDLLALTFYISGEAEDAEESVTLEDVQVLDGNGNPIPVLVDGGSVTVKAGLVGDVDNDGQVTVSDSLRLKQHLVGIFPREEICNADINGDGVVDLQDALRLDQFLSGKTDG